MTGPEHYREAERLLKSAADNFLRTGNAGSALEAAQVHATLALVAATALPSGGAGTASRQEWVRAVRGLGDDYDVTESFA